MEAIAAIMSQIWEKKTVHKFLPWQNQPGCRPLIKVNCLVLLQPFVMDQRHVRVWTQQLRREYIKRSKFLGTRKHRCGHNDYVSAMNIFFGTLRLHFHLEEKVEAFQTSCHLLACLDLT